MMSTVHKYLWIVFRSAIFAIYIGLIYNEICFWSVSTYTKFMYV
jgi:hypothetical protein